MLWIILSLVLVQVPQAPPRDAPPAREGTASVRGTVAAADSGVPLRRAFVTLFQIGVNTGQSGSRSVATDADGRFAFTRLAAGSYRLRVAPGSFRGQYLGAAYGGRRQSDPGQTIELKDGQRFEASVALPRGAAIAGRVVDEFGEPITRVLVYPSRVMPGNSFQRTGGGVNLTDDLGRFRVYGLEPGEYILAAEARGPGGPPVEGASEGFATTYFPSTLNEREAGRVRVAGGADVGDVDIHLVRTRTFQITGLVMDSQGRQNARPNVQLVRPSTASGYGSFGSSTDPSGKFTIRDVVPGEYRLVVRPASMGGPPGQQLQSQERPEYATMPLSVASDIDNLVVTTQPAVSISGQIVFSEGTPANLPSGIRVMAQPGDRTMMFGPSSTTTVGPSLQFTLNDLFGSYLVRPVNLPPGYALKAVMLGMTDVIDTPVEFRPEHSKHLQLVLTSRASMLEGMVTDDNGEPATNATILMIPEEKTSWKLGSAKMRVTGIMKAGRFSITGVLPGRYYVIAMSRENIFLGPDLGAEFFEPLTKEATVVVIAEDEKRTVDLRVAKGS